MHILVSFTIGLGLNIPQFFAFKTEEVDILTLELQF